MSMRINVPDDPALLSEFFLLALAIYREARGESLDAKRAVAWTIRNRVEYGRSFGSGWYGVITRPYQFSSFNRADANVTVFPPPNETAWQESVTAATDVMFAPISMADPTGGAMFYYDRSMTRPPEWAAHYRHTVDVGAFHFYALN